MGYVYHTISDYQRRIREYDLQEEIRKEREQEMIDSIENESIDLLDTYNDYGLDADLLSGLKNLKKRIEKFECDTGNEASDATLENIKTLERMIKAN